MASAYAYGVQPGTCIRRGRASSFTALRSEEERGEEEEEKEKDEAEEKEETNQPPCRVWPER